MKQYRLVPQEIQPLVDFILEPAIEKMVDWSFSYHYFLKSGLDNGYIRRMFLNYMKQQVRKYGYEPTPIDEQAEREIDMARMYHESWVERIENERYGIDDQRERFKIFRNIDENIIENPPKEEY